MSDEQKLLALNLYTDSIQNMWKRCHYVFIPHKYQIYSIYRRILKKTNRYYHSKMIIMISEMSIKKYYPGDTPYDRMNFGNFGSNCPFCHKKKYNRPIKIDSNRVGYKLYIPFTVDNLTNTFYCKSCKITGDGLDLLVKLLKISKVDAVRTLAKYNNYPYTCRCNTCYYYEDAYWRGIVGIPFAKRKEISNNHPRFPMLK